MSAYAWPLVVLALGLGLLRLGFRFARLSDAQREERRAWRTELDGVRVALEAGCKRVEALEHWRVLLRNRQGGKD